MLPAAVEAIHYKGDESKVSMKRLLLVTVERHSPERDAFTLAVLDLPVGTPVSDLRIKRRIGYWDGKALTGSLPSTEPIADFMPQAQHTGRWYWLGSLTVALIIAFLILLFSFRAAAKRVPENKP